MAAVPAPSAARLETAAARGGGRSVKRSPETIEVKAGDTLYSLARRHNVPLDGLKAANGLKDANLRPGQKLVLPLPDRGGSAGAGGKAEKSAGGRENARDLPRPPPGWTGSHTLKAGESLYRVSRLYKVKLSELQSVNGINDPRRVRPGTVLRVPGGAAAPRNEAEAAPAARPAETTPAPRGGAGKKEAEKHGEDSRTPREPGPGAVPAASGAASGAPTALQPVVINAPTGRDTAAADSPALKAASAAQDGTRTAVLPSPPLPEAAGRQEKPDGKLLWPVKGRILTGFGRRPDGTQSDGIDIAVPLGTDVRAAGEGTVAYAGNELQGYGNLILLRHDNGWVTAYAHNDRLMVARGDKVRRGQVIAKAGKTGQVAEPRLHFELRQDAKPVDPKPFLEEP